MIEPEERPSTTALVVSALVFYGLMIVLGTGLLEFTDADALTLIFGSGTTVKEDTLYGAGCGLLVVAVTYLFRNQKPVQRLNEEFREILGAPSSQAIAILAISSAVGEEILFRGALQETIGFFPTVICFGLMHGGLSPKYRVWALFATLAGVLLGWLASYTGNLLAPIICHMTVNYFNLHLVWGQTEAGKHDQCEG